MKKNILVLLLTVGLIALNVGCTSKESQSDDQSIENADVEKIEAIDTGDAPADIALDGTAEAPATDAPAEAPAEGSTDTAAAPAAGDDLSLEASLNDTSAPADAAATPPADAAAATPEVAAGTPTLDETSLTADAAPAPAVTDSQLAPDPALAADASAPPPATSEITETPITDTSSMSAATSDVAPTPVAKSSGGGGGSALKKITETTPYQAKDGGWINSVYIARPGEKLADISQKIFGADKTKDLKAIKENNYLKWRAPKGGDKVYYVSPNRPDDATKTMLYYEDMGMVPETYVAKKGDNLKKVSKELLGYDNAWKEVWASNGVESKVSLKEGDTIRFWKSGGEVMAMAPPSPPPTDAMAAAPPPPAGATVTDTPPNATATTAPPTGSDSASLPPPPADAAASLPPPPTDGSMAAGATDSAPPPPPIEDTPPPPPPPTDDSGAVAAADGPKKDLDEAAAEEEEPGELNSDAMMTMGAIGILVAMFAFLIIRKRKQKSQMNNLEMNA